MIRINLLPRERVRRPAVAPRALALLLVGVILVGALASTLYLNARNARVRAEVDRVNAEIEALRPRVQRVEALRRQIEAARRKEQLLRQLEATRVPWDTVLEELRTVMPQDVWLTQVEVRDVGDLVFNGYGMSYEAVARFMVSLEGSPLFKDVDMLISQQQLITNRPVINFSLTAKLSLERKEAVSR